MKILQINKFYYLKGGSERYLFALSDLLSKKGHRVIPFSMQHPLNSPSEYSGYFVGNIDMHKFSPLNIFKFFYNYEAVRNLKKLIKKERPDIAHLHNFAHQLTPAIIRVLKKEGIPVIVTLHAYKMICPNSMLFNRKGNCEKCLGGKYYNCLANRCMHDSYLKSLLGMLEAYWNNSVKKHYDDVDLFIAPSRYMKDVTVKFGVPAEKIKVLYNFLPDEGDEETKRRGLYGNRNLPSDAVAENDDYFLYFGRLSYEKGIEMMIEAFSKTKDKSRKLLIAGSGPLEARLREQIGRLDLSQRVELIGFKKQDELNRLIEGAKAVIMPSLWPENMPYSLLESMAKGRIVIISQVGGMAELIENGKNGFAFKGGNVIELTGYMDRITELGPEAEGAIGENARKTVEKLRSDEHFKELADLYIHLK